MDDELTINSRAAAAIFANDRQHRLLLDLVDREQSVSAIARTFGMRLSLVHYHLGRLRDAGLIQETRAERRRGSPIRFYRAVARRFFVPAEWMEKLPDAGRLAALQGALDRSLAGRVQGILYEYRDGPRMRVVRTDDGGEGHMQIWEHLRLNPADARELARALRTVIQTFERRHPTGDRAYLLHLAIVAE